MVAPRLRTALRFACAVFRGCALRFAPCARHFSPSGLRCSQAHSRLSLPYWGLRTGLRFAGPVFRGCGALRAVPQFSMVVPLRSQARLRHSLLHWGLRTGLRFASPVFRGCGRPLGVSSPLHPFGASTGLLRPVSRTARGLRAPLAPPPLRGFDDYGLFPPQAAAFVRPSVSFADSSPWNEPFGAAQP